MASPTVRVNTLVQWKEKPFVDPLSKLYVILEAAFGLNRLPLIIKRHIHIYFRISLMYAAALSSTLVYTSFVISQTTQTIFIFMNIFEYAFCLLFGVITWKRMQLYYIELSRFDVEVGCRPKIASESTRNLIQMVVINCFFSFFYIFAYNVEEIKEWLVQMIPFHFVHALEVHYIGHLFSLLIPRLRLINYYAESSLSNVKMTTAPKVDEFEYFKYNHANNSEMKKLMDLYHIVIKAYDFLAEAIKWQFLVIIITSFISILSLAYHVSLSIIQNAAPLVDVVSDVGLAVTKMLPLFSPCIFGDRVHSEVHHLRELIASRLYENKLDKSSRSTARALLALTEARDLSFWLLRMLEIDISFPFKFLGLLVTYLIILLQFEKVINP